MPENLVNLETVTATVPGDASRVLLDAVSLGVAVGERVGVVGLNGGGKTTLLEVLTGERAPDSGRVSAIRGLRSAVVTQRTELPAGARIRDVVLASLRVSAEHEWASQPRVRSVLGGLGITDLERTVDGLSGGERRRVALAAALVGELDLVVLDEPTNHLDVEGVAWLAEHLVQRRCAVVVVTHDRWFLDTVCTRTWEVAGGRVESYLGGYADWIFARAERARQADAAEERRRNLARKELAWLRRGPPARTSKPRFRIEAAEALIADVPAPRNDPELLAFATQRLGKTVLELEDATLSVGARELLRGVTWRLGPGERIGLVGINGSGKTTLLRALAGERPLDAGRLVTGRTVRLAHMSQELAGPADGKAARDDAGGRRSAGAASVGAASEGSASVAAASGAAASVAALPEDRRVLEAVEDVARFVRLGRHELSASSMLERLGFPAARQWTPVAELSGGERRRLQLTRLLMDEPNVLLLDEPTNDLDVDTLSRLEDLLDGWPGTLVVVSHDRYLVERVCDTVMALFGDGRLTHLPGGIQEYLDRRAGGTPPVTSAPASGTGQRNGGRTGNGPAGPAPSTAAEQREARKEVRRVERRLEVLAARESALHLALAEAAADPPTVLALDIELRELVAERDRLEEQWLLAAETAEG